MKNRKDSKILISSLLGFLLLVRFTVGSVVSEQISTPAVQLHSRFDELDLNIRMSEIEAKSKHQEKEISTLKTLRLEDKKEISQLRERVEQLEASEVKTTKYGKILDRQKRPFRLASANLHR